MPSNRQGSTSTTPRTGGGRTKQKQRTRRAIVDAAQAMVDRGEHPTVATAAAEADMSRTTAYRYFPTQDSLLVELAVRGSVANVDVLLEEIRGQDGDAESHLVALVDSVNRRVLADELLHRSAQRVYLDMWIAAERAGDGHDRQVRRGQRREWFAVVLEPLRDQLTPAAMDRLQHALCLVAGGEAITVLHDVAHLDDDDALAVTTWATRALLRAALDDTGG